MQKVLIVKDEQSITSLNDVLKEEEFAISNVSSSPQGGWLVILDNELEIDEDYMDYLDFEEEETEEEGDGR